MKKRPTIFFLFIQENFKFDLHSLCHPAQLCSLKFETIFQFYLTLLSKRQMKLEDFFKFLRPVWNKYTNVTD